VRDARDALLEVAGALRGRADDVADAADFAAAVCADDGAALQVGGGARDALYLLYPSLCPL